jgi:aminoglycoside 6-adenylyltransferase
MPGESHTFYTLLEEKIITWIRAEENIRAAIIVGSRARLEHPADDWSDLDVILFTTTPDAYLNRLDWIEAFAPVWLTLRQRTVAGDPERLVVFEGGWQTDFVFDNSAVLQAIPQMIAAGNIPDTIRRGVRVLVDKDGALAQLPRPSAVPLPPPPTAQQFTDFYELFWFKAIFASKQLCRGELIRYKSCEEGLRGHLVQLIEWHARATCGADTWHAGRFLDSWAEPSIYTALAQSYTPLEPRACMAAFRTLIELFCRLTPETAAALDLQYPAEKTPALLAYLQRLWR